MKIVTNLSKGDKNIEKYLYFLYERCDKYDVAIDLVNKKYLKDDYGLYGGSFGLFPSATITVAIRTDITAWLPTLVHEASHMDQWIEGCKAWTDLYTANGEDSATEFFSWLSYDNELSPHEAELHMKKVIDLEYDCEKRVNKIIKKFNLPIDHKIRTKQAMSYIWSYVLCYKYRQWYKGSNSPMKIEDVYNLAPSRFIKNIYLPSEAFIKSCSKNCFNIDLT